MAAAGCLGSMLTVIFILVSELKCVCRLAGHDGFGDGQGLLALKLALFGVKLLKEKFGVLAVDGVAGGEPAGLVPEAGVGRLRHGVAGSRQPARPKGRLHHDPVGVAGAGFAKGEEMHDEFRVASGEADWVAFDFHKSFVPLAVCQLVARHAGSLDGLGAFILGVVKETSAALTVVTGGRDGADNEKLAVGGVRFASVNRIVHLLNGGAEARG